METKLTIKIKKLSENAIIPTYAKPGDAGMDLYATSVHPDEHNINYVYGTGIAIEIPEGYVGLVFPRSSIRNTSLILSNSVGVIDSGYRGEIMVTFKNFNYPDIAYNGYLEGHRIAQLVIVPFPTVQLLESEELNSSERGEGGFGHTGT